jgi:C4-type Zn-finger protein
LLCLSDVTTVAPRTTRSSLPEVLDVRVQDNTILADATIIISIAEGTVYTARILARSDLDRQIVRSAACEILIPEFELTLPSSQRGQLTTVEGLIRDIVADLSPDQALRRIQAPEQYEKIQALLDKLNEILGDDEDEEAYAYLYTQIGRSFGQLVH